MTVLRLIADDLTGALDTAAEFVPLTGPVSVYWNERLPKVIDGSVALDSGTREKSAGEAAATVGAMATHLAGSDIAYKKVDSLLRGHTMAELAACWKLGAWDHCIIAPAFPHQGRVTKRGVQFRQQPSGDWTRVADVAALAAAGGLDVHVGNTDGALRDGVHVFDAETDENLLRIAACGRAAPGRVLWCGSAGLAQALVGKAATGSPMLPPPLLGLFGSDQPVTARQLAACGRHWIAFSDGGEANARTLSRKLERDGVAFASFDLPAGLSRAAAARRIAESLETLLRRLARPETLAVAGGETLRAVCNVLGAARLDAIGQIEPGLPRSILRGGKWDGLSVISKSGAFGTDRLWRNLLEANGFEFERAYS
jgi:D-threonate/D-erythronate kinase